MAFKKLIATTFNPLTAKLFNLNFHPLEIVSRWRDPRLGIFSEYQKPVGMFEEKLENQLSN